MGSEPAAVAIGKRLREARERGNLSGAELGRLLGLAPSQVSKMETGAQRIPSDLLPRWCEVVGITLADAYGVEHRHHFAQIPFSPHVARLYAQLPPAWQAHAQRVVESLYRLYQQLDI